MIRNVLAGIASYLTGELVLGVIMVLILAPILLAGKLGELGAPAWLVWYPAIFLSIGIGLYMMWWIVKNIE